MIRWVLCTLLRRHGWRDLDRTRSVLSDRELDWTTDNARHRDHDGRPFIRVCERCGRVESLAFTNKWHRMRHMESSVL